MYLLSIKFFSFMLIITYCPKRRNRFYFGRGIGNCYDIWLMSLKVQMYLSSEFCLLLLWRSGSFWHVGISRSKIWKGLWIVRIDLKISKIQSMRNITTQIVSFNTFLCFALDEWASSFRTHDVFSASWALLPSNDISMQDILSLFPSFSARYKKFNNINA